MSIVPTSAPPLFTRWSCSHIAFFAAITFLQLAAWQLCFTPLPEGPVSGGQVALVAERERSAFTALIAAIHDGGDEGTTQTGNGGEQQPPPPRTTSRRNGEERTQPDASRVAADGGAASGFSDRSGGGADETTHRLRDAATNPMWTAAKCHVALACATILGTLCITAPYGKHASASAVAVASKSKVGTTRSERWSIFVSSFSTLIDRLLWVDPRWAWLLQELPVVVAIWNSVFGVDLRSRIAFLVCGLNNGVGAFRTARRDVWWPSYWIGECVRCNESTGSTALASTPPMPSLHDIFLRCCSVIAELIATNNPRVQSASIAEGALSRLSLPDGQRFEGAATAAVIVLAATCLPLLLVAVHYVHRAFIYPFRNPSVTRVPIYIVCLANAYCCFNGSLLSASAVAGCYRLAEQMWLAEAVALHLGLPFVSFTASARIGWCAVFLTAIVACALSVGVFAKGMAINIRADNHLFQLKRQVTSSRGGHPQPRQAAAVTPTTTAATHPSITGMTTTVPGTQKTEEEGGGETVWKKIVADI